MPRLDKNTFERLYYRYGLRLEAYARKFLKDPSSSKDAIQDVFVRFWEKYQGKSSDAWAPVLFAMVRNKCIDSLRRLVSKRSMTVPQVSMTREEEVLFNRAFTADTDEGLLLEELDAAIKAVTDSLTPRCREIFQLSRVQGLSNKEIALKLGITEKAVEKNITSALKAFRENISKNR